MGYNDDDDDDVEKNDIWLPLAKLLVTVESGNCPNNKCVFRNAETAIAQKMNNRTRNIPYNI